MTNGKPRGWTRFKARDVGHPAEFSLKAWGRILYRIWIGIGEQAVERDNRGNGGERARLEGE